MRKKRGTPLAALACALIVAAAAGAGCGARTSTVTLLSPTSGPPGTVVSIEGSGFGGMKGMSKVQFSGETVGVKTWSDTAIVATVTVVTDNASSEAGEFEVKGNGKPDNGQARQGGGAQKGVIETYAKTHNISLTGPGGTREINLHQASKEDPDWEIWQMPCGKGEDVDYFLLENQDGQWTCINGGLWGTTQPQGFGAPDDLRIPPSP